MASAPSGAGDYTAAAEINGTALAYRAPTAGSLGKNK